MNKITNTKLIIAAIAVFAVLSCATFVFGSAIERSEPAQVNRQMHVNFFASSTLSTLNATTTSATSTNLVGYFDSSGRLIDGAVDLRGADNVTFLFQRGDTSGNGNSGSSRFKVQVSANGSTWLDYTGLRSAEATSTDRINRVQYVTVSGTSTAIYSMDVLGFYSARCIVDETTDGEHTCSAVIDY